MATLTQMLDGMAAFFLDKEEIKQKIGQRMQDTIAEQRIVALESPNDERSPRLQQFVEYRDVGETVGRLKSAESAMVFTNVEVNCYAQFPRDARALLELFFAQFTKNKYSGTWTDAQGNTVKVKGAHWDRATRNTDYDDTARLSVASCVLTVPWLQR